MYWEQSYEWSRASSLGLDSVGGIPLDMPEFAFLALKRRRQPSGLLVGAIRYLAKDIKDEDAAKISKLTPEGMKARRRYAKQKMGARNNMHATSIAFHNGWIAYDLVPIEHNKELSPMQTKVLKLGLLGLNVHEVAAAFDISRWTVDAHFQEILMRKSATSRPNSVLRAYEDGTFSPDRIILDADLAEEIGPRLSMLASEWKK